MTGTESLESLVTGSPGIPLDKSTAHLITQPSATFTKLHPTHPAHIDFSLYDKTLLYHRDTSPIDTPTLNTTLTDQYVPTCLHRSLLNASTPQSPVTPTHLTSARNDDPLDY